MSGILIIDDNSDNLTVLAALIAEAFPGTGIHRAEGGEQGIGVARAEDPDVVLLDVVMPRIDGFETCRRLRAEPSLRDIPVVFLTALQDTRESRIRALEAGGDAFLAKPVDPVELTAQIRAMVKVKTANRLLREERRRLEALVALRTAELRRSQLAMLNLLEDLKAENEARKAAAAPSLP